MTPQPADNIKRECIRCNHSFSVTDEQIKELVARQQNIYKSVERLDAEEVFEINVDCAICGQVNVITLRNKKKP